MGLFDLIFIFLFLTAAGSLVTAGVLAVAGQGRRSGRILVRLLAGAAVYLGVVAAVSVVLPRRVVAVGEPQCFDDWCIAVAGFRRAGEQYEVDFAVSSRARRVAQREKHVTVYLTDGQGRRYDPVADAAAAPFDVLLGPGDSAEVSRRFVVPKAAGAVGVVIGHEGGFPIGWFIVGYDTWFRKPALTALD
jgi:hypothetical protein